MYTTNISNVKKGVKFLYKNELYEKLAGYNKGLCKSLAEDSAKEKRLDLSTKVVVLSKEESDEYLFDDLVNTSFDNLEGETYPEFDLNVVDDDFIDDNTKEDVVEVETEEEVDQDDFSEDNLDNEFPKDYNSGY